MDLPGTKKNLVSIVNDNVNEKEMFICANDLLEWH